MKITHKEFTALCNELTISQFLAFENDEVCTALENGAGVVEMYEVLCEQF